MSFVRLEDAPGRALPRNAQRLAGHDRILLVRPHVELLDLVPVLGLVERTIRPEPRGRVELEVLGLIDGPACSRRSASDRIGGLPSRQLPIQPASASCPSGRVAAASRGVGCPALSAGSVGGIAGTASWAALPP